jgi:uncharacterized membrane protein YhaH (DUF805 family)
MHSQGGAVNTFGSEEQVESVNGHSIVSAVKTVVQNYATFSGRAPRSEFWYWVLAVTLISMPVLFGSILLEPVIGYDASFGIWAVFRLSLLIPTAAVIVRRLHDTDRSGFWALLWPIPLLSIVPFIFMLQRGTPASNRYGP